MFADPELTLDLPPAVTAATGMDALTHNVESYLSPAYHPLCDGIALEGVRIAARALPIAVKDGRNLAARGDMLMSSMMGAIAFQKDLGAVHSCAHALSTVADLHHGLANGIMIDHVMNFNLPAATAKLAELAHVARAPGGDAGSDEARAQAFIAWLATLKARHRHSGDVVRRTTSTRPVTRADIPALVDDRRRRHLPPDQSAQVHGRRFRGAVRGRPVMPMLKIGISASFFHERSAAPDLQGDDAAVHRAERRALADAARRAGVHDPLARRPHAPRVAAASRWTTTRAELDGLVLMGGSDVCPETYGEKALKPEWNGDSIRDEYEIALLNAFVGRRKPVLGICRGAQVINVAFGGTLYQDIGTQLPGALQPSRLVDLRAELPRHVDRRRHAARAPVPGTARW